MAGGRQAGGPRSIATPNPKINNEGGYDNRRARESGRRHSEVSIFVAVVDVIRLLMKLWSISWQDQGRPIHVLLYSHVLPVSSNHFSSNVDSDFILRITVVKAVIILDLASASNILTGHSFILG
jgi:hypothetical protein